MTFTVLISLLTIEGVLVLFWNCNCENLSNLLCSVTTIFKLSFLINYHKEPQGRPHPRSHEHRNVFDSGRFLWGSCGRGGSRGGSLIAAKECPNIQLLLLPTFDVIICFAFTSLGPRHSSHFPCQTKSRHTHIKTA